MNRKRGKPSGKPVEGISPGVAAGLGAGVGLAMAILAMVISSRGWSRSEFLILLLTVVPVCAVFGYICWLQTNRAREKRWARIGFPVAISTTITFLLGFPILWQQFATDPERFLLVLLLTFIFPVAWFIVGAGFGVVHLVRVLVGLARRLTRPENRGWKDGVWDRDLDDRPGTVEY